MLFRRVSYRGFQIQMGQNKIGIGPYGAEGIRRENAPFEFAGYGGENELSLLDHQKYFARMADIIELKLY